MQTGDGNDHDYSDAALLKECECIKVRGIDMSTAKVVRVKVTTDEGLRNILCQKFAITVLQDIKALMGTGLTLEDAKRQVKNAHVSTPGYCTYRAFHLFYELSDHDREKAQIVIGALGFSHENGVYYEYGGDD